MHIKTPLFILLLLCSFASPLNANDSLINSICDEISIDSIRKHMQNLENFVSRYAFNPNTREVAEYIQNYFIDLQIPSVELDSFQLIGQVLDTTWQYNVIASIPGTVAPDRVLILGAHHDAMNYSTKDTVPGADDNASGVAGMLEVARVLQEKNYSPKNTIRYIAFAAEEVYRLLMGSKDYAAKAADMGMDIRLMLCLDMLAWTVDTVNWQMNVEQYPGQEWIMPMLQTAVAKVSPITVAYHGASYYSDSYSFYDQGYPAVWLVENYGPESHPSAAHPYYHTINDRLENYDLGYCTELVKAVGAIMLYADDTLATVGIIHNDIIPQKIKPFTCTYNQSTKQIVISWSELSQEPNSISLYSVQGRRLYTADVSQNKKNTVSLNPGALTSYAIGVISVSYPDRVHSEKIVISK